VIVATAAIVATAGTAAMGAIVATGVIAAMAGAATVAAALRQRMVLLLLRRPRRLRPRPKYSRGLLEVAGAERSEGPAPCGRGVVSSAAAT
jgi:hypothetical protein